MIITMKGTVVQFYLLLVTNLHFNFVLLSIALDDNTGMESARVGLDLSISF